MFYTKNGVEYKLQSKDVAHQFGFTDTHIRRLASKKEIPSIRVGRRYWFNPAQVEQALVKVNESKASEVNSGESTDLDELIAGI